MYKVFLVDDEPVVLESMKTVIEWEYLGFTICGEAESGEEAWGLLDKCRPDLVITDVMMAQMSGIELAEHINLHYPDIEVIIISGYDEFDFVRSAMQAGVVEYLTKPTEKRELERVLKKIARRIQKRTDFENSLREMKEITRKNLPILRNQFYNDLMNQIIAEEEIPTHFNYYASPLTCNPYQLWRFRLDQTEQRERPGMRELLRAQLEMLLRDQLQQTCPYDFFVRGRDLCCIVEDGREKTDSQGTVREMLEDVLQEFQNLTRNSVSVGISRKYESYLTLSRAAQDCEAALEFRYNLGEGNCIFFDEVQNISGRGADSNYELLNKACMKLRALNKTDAKALIERIYRELKENNAIYQQAYSQTVLLMTELYAICCEEKIRNKIMECLRELYRYQTADALQALVVAFLDEILDAAVANVTEKNEQIIQQVKAYVEAHLGEKISLVDVADTVHLSKNYFCNIFKKEQGETFFAYLMRMRMEKAKELLRTTDHKVYVIAELVGYTDYFYFSQVFKKYAGVTAGEYREIYDGE